MSSEMPKDHTATAYGVFFSTRERAKLYADAFDKDLVEQDGGWLAKNRTTTASPMPTKEGDVVILHFRQLFRVWLTTWDGAQGGDPNIGTRDFWKADEAEAYARDLAADTGGKIYRLQKDGQWAESSN
jgi:hypothetical protein